MVLTFVEVPIPSCCRQILEHNKLCPVGRGQGTRNYEVERTTCNTAAMQTYVPVFLPYEVIAERKAESMRSEDM